MEILTPIPGRGCRLNSSPNRWNDVRTRQKSGQLETCNCWCKQPTAVPRLAHQTQRRQQAGNAQGQSCFLGRWWTSFIFKISRADDIGFTSPIFFSLIVEDFRHQTFTDKPLQPSLNDYVLPDVALHRLRRYPSVHASPASAFYCSTCLTNDQKRVITILLEGISRRVVHPSMIVEKRGDGLLMSIYIRWRFGFVDRRRLAIFCTRLQPPRWMTDSGLPSSYFCSLQSARNETIDWIYQLSKVNSSRWP